MINKQVFLSASLWVCALSLSFGCTISNPDYEPGFGQDGGHLTAFDPIDLVDPLTPGPMPGDPASPPVVDPEPSDSPKNEDPKEPPSPEEPPPGDLPLEDPPPPPPPPPVQSDFGQLCTAQCPGDELCVFTSSSATHGICLRECAVADEPCEVPDASFFSGCAQYFNPDLGPVNVCAIFCFLHGQSFPCPNQTDYTCKSYGPAIGVCVAK